MSEPILEVRQVVKRYGGLTAVDGVSFAVDRGICFGLLGPNGAGKTTTIEIMEGILAPTSGEVRYRGEAVLALVGDRTVEAIPDAALPIAWQPLPPIVEPEAALAQGAAVLHAFRPDNVLISGHLKKGDVQAGLTGAKAVATGYFETPFVEHAYVEPEAGWARRVGDRRGVDRLVVTVGA